MIRNHENSDSLVIFGVSKNMEKKNKEENAEKSSDFKFYSLCLVSFSSFFSSRCEAPFYISVKFKTRSRSERRLLVAGYAVKHIQQIHDWVATFSLKESAATPLLEVRFLWIIEALRKVTTHCLSIHKTLCTQALCWRQQILCEVLFSSYPWELGWGGGGGVWSTQIGPGC